MVVGVPGLFGRVTGNGVSVLATVRIREGGATLCMGLMYAVSASPSAIVTAQNGISVITNGGTSIVVVLV